MFKKTKTPVLSKKTNLPLGTYIHTEKGYFYILSDEKRLRFLSKRVLDSWQPLRVVEATEEAVKHYRVAAKMKFRNGSLITNISDGKIYLIVEGKRRQIINPDVLETIGATTKDVVFVSHDEVKLHELGETLG